MELLFLVIVKKVLFITSYQVFPALNKKRKGSSGHNERERGERDCVIVFFFPLRFFQPWDHPFVCSGQMSWHVSLMAQFTWRYLGLRYTRAEGNKPGGHYGGNWSLSLYVWGHCLAGSAVQSPLQLAVAYAHTLLFVWFRDTPLSHLFTVWNSEIHQFRNSHFRPFY